MTLNQAAFVFIHQFAGRAVALDWAGIFFAEYLPYLLVAGFLLLVAYERGWRRKLYLFAEGAMGIILARGLITEIIRFLYHHERPFSFYGFVPLIPEAGWSFPSGHAAWFFALATAVWYTNRKWGYWYLGLSLVMGAARIFVGVHWPLDILGGIPVGIVSAWATHLLLSPSRKALFDSFHEKKADSQ